MDIYSFKKRKTISPLQFSWYSNEEALKNSAFELKSSDDINDLHLGSTIDDHCLTCGGTYKDCPGHYGHYTFLFPLIHPLRTAEAKKRLAKKYKKLKFFVKQNILNVKHVDKPFKCFTVLDLHDFEDDNIDQNFPYFVKHFPISPPCLRPTCTTVSSKVSVSQNDITHRLGSLIRIDQTLRKAYALNANNKEELVRILSRLQLAFTLLFYPPPGVRESRELSCLTDRLRGKDGRMRLSLLGKRVEFSSRSVISGDNYLELDQVGVPNAIANSLTLPEYVCDFNRDYLKGLLLRKMIKVIQRGSRTIDPKYGNHDLYIGDVVHRYLLDDDYVLLNRQPSLWASSIQAMRVKRVPANSRVDPHSIRLNVEITAGFNADFDGDEMCLYAVQSVESRAEMKHLMSVAEHLIIAGNGVIQDSALGVYLLSVYNRTLSRALFYDCIMWIKQPFFCDHPFKPPYTSRKLLSFLFPPYVNLDGHVKDGVVIGILNKKIVRNKLLPQIHTRDPQLALQFLYSLQRVTSEFLRRRGFSVGLDALLPDKPVNLNIKKTYKKMNKWEMSCLGRKLKDEKAQEAKKLFDHSNTFMQLTSECSGAKGSLMNILSMKASVGQQYVNGNVIKNYRKSNYGNRVLSSDKFGEDNIFVHGYIKGAFLTGLNPKEMFLHSISSRINLLDTALKTANSGYCSRKIWKNLEDAVVQHETALGGSMSIRCSGKMLRYDITENEMVNRKLCPGYPIGIILSQNIGQKIMQLTLNTFHNVGSGNAVVEGVPRLEALINRWQRKQEEQTILTCRMTTFDIHKMIMQRDHVIFDDIVTTFTVKKKVCYIQGDIIQCIRLRLHPFQLEEAINVSFLGMAFDATCDDNFKILVKAKIKGKNHIPWKEFEEVVKRVRIRGEEKIHVFDNDGELQLTGTTLANEFNKLNPLSLTLKSNNVIEVRRTLGIEAAYATLVYELDKVFNGSVDKFLFKVLAEYMCYNGVVSAATRMGISSFYDDNVFKSMSFERTLKTASTAADRNLATRFDGLSERIITNKLIRHGSGFLDVVKEKADCCHEECWKGACVYSKKRKRFQESDDEDPWLMDVEDDEDNHFSSGYTMPIDNVLMPIVKERPPSPTYDPFAASPPPSPTYSPTNSR